MHNAQTMVCQICNYRSYVAVAVLRACTLLVKAEVQGVQTIDRRATLLLRMRKSHWRGVHGVEINMSKVDGGGLLISSNTAKLPPAVLLLLDSLC